MAAAQARSVLIVDDDASFRELLRGLVEEAGFRVAGEARDGVEGVELANELKPDIITMDLEMPRLDGVKATEQLCEGACAPIVIVSGSQSSDQVAAALLAGARWHVAKRDATEQLPAVLAALAAERTT